MTRPKTMNDPLTTILKKNGFEPTGAGGGCVGYVREIGRYELWVSDVDHPHVPEEFPCGIRALIPEKDYDEVDLGEHWTVRDEAHLQAIVLSIEQMAKKGESPSRQ